MKTKQELLQMLFAKLAELQDLNKKGLPLKRFGKQQILLLNFRQKLLYSMTFSVRTFLKNTGSR